MGTLLRSRPSRRLNAPILVALTALTLFQGTPASGVVDIPEIHEELADFDSRTGRVQPTAQQVAIAENLGASVRWNRFGTPASLIRHGGYLAPGVKASDAATAARSWLNANAELFGSSRNLALASEGPLAGGAGHAVTFRRMHGTLVASPEGFITVGLVEGARDRWRVAYASSTMPGGAGVRGSFDLSAREAWVEAADAVGEDVSQDEVATAGTRAGWTRLRVDGFDQPQFVRGVAFPTLSGRSVRAYETTVSQGREDGHFGAYRQIVDAGTGEVLFRQNMVDHATDNPEWEVFPWQPPMTPLNRYPWNYPSDDTRELWCWLDDPACQLVVANSAARVPWDTDAETGTPTNTTIGNAADSQEEWFSEPPHIGPGPSQYRPSSPTRDYMYPWTNAWFETGCDPDNFVVGSGNDIDAAATNLFAMHNRMHDWAYYLGFTEETWNAQNFNFGSPTLENDELDGNVQAGGVSGGAPTWSGRDNAFMFTRPDGMRSITSMFLWQPIAGAFYAPCVDGDYDMAVIGHEYTHMIENRMIGKGVRRQGFHAGAMGESEADFTAMEYLFEYGFSDDAVGPYGQWAVGPYVTGNTLRAIRNYNMAFPSAGAFPQPAQYPQINPLNFGAVGYDMVGPQVHADGEIWSATNFDIRELFLDRYPAMSDAQQRQCADGELPADQCPGNRRWIQLIFDAYLLAPVEPTFLDMRDAILAADVMRFGGANQDLLWEAFARRGFGENAFTSGASDTEPVPDFESPLHGEATVVFNAVSRGGGNAPVKARIHVGHYEARVSPIADTNPATKGAINLDNTARFLPDEAANVSGHPAYDFVAHAPGYGHVRFRLDGLEAGETYNVTIRFPVNIASSSRGAKASGDGSRHNALIDDTEGTNWESTGAPVEGRQVVIRLPGLRTFDLVKVSAMLLPGQNRFTALRSFELYACTVASGAPCDPTATDRWTLVHQSDPDAFPADNPRPVSPHLLLRTFPVETTTATHVLFRVVDNQCTGQTSFQGEQDNDPANQTDCRTGSPPLPPRDTEVRAAELQLFNERPAVTVAVAVE
jgi:extracellular elastinolytic metalloproteinase